MRLSTLCMTTLLAVGGVGIAQATPTITNGDFSSSGQSTPWQFGANSGSGGIHGGASCTYGGNFITGWQGNGGYEIWYNSASAASTVEPCS